MGPANDPDFPLPPHLPVPVDDGAAAYLAGRTLPRLELPATSGGPVTLSALGPQRAVLYLYPMTGRPGVALPEGWDLIPGARGCTPESCGFRDHHAGLVDRRVTVYGVSSQPTAYQQEAAERLRLPFALLSDERLALADALSLPTFEAGGMRLFKRLTVVVAGGAIEHAFYPVFPPDTHAAAVVAWLDAHPRG